MKKFFLGWAVILCGLLLFSCAATRTFIIPVVNSQKVVIKDTIILVRPYGLFNLRDKVDGVKYRMRWTNVFPLVAAPVFTGGWYLFEAKPTQNFVVKN